ncbi:hypothetical protein R1sor_027349 [Riccia sorocarpa]|uniref:Uncharacterized protein n=1 Tax=Riccia sorocarpa TaxID=122646 RepID=A0ABD3GFM3_9MARC
MADQSADPKPVKDNNTSQQVHRSATVPAWEEVLMMDEVISSPDLRENDFPPLVAELGNQGNMTFQPAWRRDENGQEQTSIRKEVQQNRLRGDKPLEPEEDWFTEVKRRQKGKDVLNDSSPGQIVKNNRFQGLEEVCESSGETNNQEREDEQKKGAEKGDIGLEEGTDSPLKNAATANSSASDSQGSPDIGKDGKKENRQTYLSGNTGGIQPGEDPENVKE